MKRRVINVCVAVLLLALVYLFINALTICQYGKKDEKQKSDVVVVLGAGTNNKGVSPVYQERLNHGIWLYENNYADYIIVTGGTGEGEKVSDAYRAKKYVCSKGVPENVVLMEEQSKITQENLEYTKEIMKENRWNTCILVSDPLHMKRAMLIARDYGMQVVSSPTPSSKYRTWKTKIPFLLREEIFYIGYKICKIFIPELIK